MSRLERFVAVCSAVIVIALVMSVGGIDSQTAAPQPKSESRLPRFWPSDFPLPPGARAVHSLFAQTPRGPTMSAWFVAPSSDEGFFRYALRKKEWSIVPLMSAYWAPPSGDGRVILAVGHGWVAGLIFGRIGQASWYDGPYGFYVYLFPGNR